MRRRAALLVGMLLLAGACSTPAGDGAPDTAGVGAAATPAERVRAAADGLVAGGGVRLAVQSRGPADGGTVSAEGTAVADLRARTASLEVELPEAGAVTARTLDRQVYAARAGATDPRWVSIGLDGLDRDAYLATVLAVSGGPTGNPGDLAVLLSALDDDAAVVGPDTVRGRPATLVEGTVDLDEVVAAAPDLRGFVDLLRDDVGLDDLPALAWVDDAGTLLRASWVLGPEGPQRLEILLTPVAPAAPAPVTAPAATPVPDLLAVLRDR